MAIRWHLTLAILGQAQAFGLDLRQSGPLAGQVVVVEDPVRGTVEIVELPAVHAPPERSADHEREHGGQRDEQVQDVHARQEGRAGAPPMRSALRTTNKELAAMPMPAIQGVSRPAMARGSATAL